MTRWQYSQYSHKINIPKQSIFSDHKILMEYYFYTRLFQKVMMVEVTEYDEVITCDHSYDKRLGDLY